MSEQFFQFKIIAADIPPGNKAIGGRQKKSDAISGSFIKFKQGIVVEDLDGIA